MSGCNSAVAGCHLGVPSLDGMAHMHRLWGVYAGVVLWRSMKLRLDVRSPRLLMTTVSHWSWQMTDAFPSSLDLTSNGIFFENLECRFHPLYQEVLSFWSSIDRPSQNLVDSGSFLEFLVVQHAILRFPDRQGREHFATCMKVRQDALWQFVAFQCGPAWTFENEFHCKVL